MFSAFDNFPALLIWLPLAVGILSFFMKKEGACKMIAMISYVLSLVVVTLSFIYSNR